MDGIKHTTGLCIILVVLFFAAAPGFSGVFIDELGRRVNIPSNPARIVSLAPNITEILFSLGLDKEIVGVTMFSNYPDAAARKAKVGSYINLSIEKIVALNPDLIISTVQGNKKETVLYLAQIGFPVYVVNSASFEDMFKAIVRIGRITSRETEARELVDNLNERVTRIVSRTEGSGKPRVLLQIGIDPIVSVGKSTIQDRLITLAGGISVTGDMGYGYPRLGMEKIISKKPDIIIVSSMKRGGDFVAVKNKWKKWKDIPAVRNDRIYVIDSDLTDHPSPRIVDGLEELAEMIHPEVMK